MELKNYTYVLPSSGSSEILIVVFIYAVIKHIYLWTIYQFVSLFAQESTQSNFPFLDQTIETWNFSNRHFETISGELHFKGDKENLTRAERSGPLFPLCFQPPICDGEQILSLGLSFPISKITICQWNTLIIPITIRKIIERSAY